MAVHLAWLEADTGNAKGASRARVVRRTPLAMSAAAAACTASVPRQACATVQVGWPFSLWRQACAMGHGGYTVPSPCSAPSISKQAGGVWAAARAFGVCRPACPCASVAAAGGRSSVAVAVARPLVGRRLEEFVSGRCPAAGRAATGGIRQSRRARPPPSESRSPVHGGMGHGAWGTWGDGAWGTGHGAHGAYEAYEAYGAYGAYEAYGAYGACGA